MQLSDILSDESIVPALKAGSKKQLFCQIPLDFSAIDLKMAAAQRQTKRSVLI